MSRELRKGHKTAILRAELREFGFSVPDRVDVHSIQDPKTGRWISYVEHVPGVDEHNELTEALESIAKAYGATYDLWPHHAPDNRVILWPIPDKKQPYAVPVTLQVGRHVEQVGYIPRVDLADNLRPALAKFLRDCADEIDREEPAR